MITTRRLIVPPAVPVVTLAEMREHMRLDTFGSPPAHPEDALVTAYVQAATDTVDGPTGWLDRALRPQRWRVTLDAFPVACVKNPDAAIVLPLPPLIEVNAVYYRAALGDAAMSTTLDPTAYQVVTDRQDFGRIVPADGTYWPTAYGTVSAVTVDFTCGYEPGSPHNNPLPELIRVYVMLVAASMYENREADTRGVVLNPVRQFRNSIEQYRMWGSP